MELSIYYSNDFNKCEIKCKRCFFKKIPSGMRYDLLSQNTYKLLKVIEKINQLCNENIEIEFYGIISWDERYIRALSKLISETRKIFGDSAEIGLHVNDARIIKTIHEQSRLDWISASIDYKQQDVRGDDEKKVREALKYAKENDIEICITTVPDKRYVKDENSIEWINDLMKEFEPIELRLFPYVPISQNDLGYKINRKEYSEWLEKLDKRLEANKVINQCFKTDKSFEYIKEEHGCYEQLKVNLEQEIPNLLFDIPVGCDVIPHYLHANTKILEHDFSLYKANKELMEKIENLIGLCKKENKELFESNGECPARFLLSRNRTLNFNKF